VLSFYPALFISLNLHYFLSNNSTDSQKKELQELYQWFVINKPYTKPKSKLLGPKPSLKLTSVPSIQSPRNSQPNALPSPLDRPQTAPAAFHHQV